MDTIVSTTLYLALIFVLAQIFKFIYGHLSLRKQLSSIPGPDTLPFIGLAWNLRKIPVEDLFEHFKTLNYQYKNGMVLGWLGTRPSLNIRKPHQIEVILKSRTLIGKGDIYDLIAYWLGNGLLTSKGEVWHRHRHLITPAFHFNILDEFTDVIVEKVEVLNECIQKEVGLNSTQKKINVFPMAIKFTLDAVCKTVMGVDLSIQKATEEIEYVAALHKFATLTMIRQFSLPLRSDMIFDCTKNGKEYRESIRKLHAFTTKVIEERRKLRKNKALESDKESSNDDQEIGKRKTRAFLDLLMDVSEVDENPLTLEEIREQVDTFMFGGHDTTATAMSYALFCLGNAPDVQKKVQQEINEVFSDPNEPISKQKLGQLKYLERVIKESLRLYSSVPFISRVLDHEVEIDNHKIPKGMLVNIQILYMHRDPDVWENPDTFDPDRFLPENSHGRHPYAFLPFSAGPRNCIGQKFGMLVLKIGLIGVLRKWTVKSELSMSDLKLSSTLVLTPRNETLNLYFTPVKSDS